MAVLHRGVRRNTDGFVTFPYHEAQEGALGSMGNPGLWDPSCVHPSSQLTVGHSQVSCNFHHRSHLWGQTPVSRGDHVCSECRPTPGWSLGRGFVHSGCPCLGSLRGPMALPPSPPGWSLGHGSTHTGCPCLGSLRGLMALPPALQGGPGFSVVAWLCSD